MIEFLQLLAVIMVVSFMICVVSAIDKLKIRYPSLTKQIHSPIAPRLVVVSFILFLISLGGINYIFLLNQVTEKDMRSGYDRIVIINEFNNATLKLTHQVSSFSPQAYEIEKPNFGKDGYCYGIVKIEREAFYKSKPLKVTNPVIGDNTDKYLYSQSDPYFYLRFLQHEGSLKNDSWEDLTDKQSDGIPVDKLPDKKLIEEIISAHQTQEFKGYATFNRPPMQSKFDYLFYIFANALSKKCIIGNSIDTDWIISQIKQNKPVIIGVGNMYSGHALLCYKVEVYDNNAFKLYVLDPNLVYSTPNANFEECTYILLWDENGKQVFNYNPQINKNYIYRGQYNSFSPRAYVNWD